MLAKKKSVKKIAGNLSRNIVNVVILHEKIAKKISADIAESHASTAMTLVDPCRNISQSEHLTPTMKLALVFVYLATTVLFSERQMKFYSRILPQ